MLFSIIITSFNYDSYISKAIDSAINQDFLEPYEVIVVDDFSTDNTREILTKFPNIKLILNKHNKGIEKSINSAIRKSNGRFIVRLDADDYLSSSFLSIMYKNIHSDDVFYYSGYDVVDSNNKMLYTQNMIKFDKKEIKCRGDFLATGTIFSRKMLNSIGLYNDAYKNCGLENYELILSLISKNYVGESIDKQLFFYRRHDSNISIKNLNRIMFYGNILAKKFNLNGYRINQYHPYLDKSQLNEQYVEYQKC